MSASTASKLDNNFQFTNLDSNFKLKFLLVEDYQKSREVIVNNLIRKNYKNIEAPDSIDNCVFQLKNGHFSHFLLDLDLSNWVGPNNTNPIKPNGVECYDGAEIAEFINKHREGVQIILYSSSNKALNDIKAKLNGSNIIFLTKECNVMLNVIDYIESSHNLRFVTTPILNAKQNIPDVIQAAFSKKFLKQFDSINETWKIGEYAWMVSVFQNNFEWDLNNLEYKNYSYNSPKGIFDLKVDKSGLGLESFFDHSSNIIINFNEIIEDDSIYQTENLNLVNKLFVTQAICKKFLLNQVTAKQAIERLKKLGQYAMFESQKILFKEFANSEDLALKRKEDIYELLKEFTINDFPRILDIYTGRVDKIENGVGDVKMEGVTPEKVGRKEKFTTKFLNNHHIFSVDTQFEYTIFDFNIDGGSAYHIELV